MERLSDRAAILMDDGQRERHIAEQWVQEYPAFRMETIPTEQGAIILRNYSPDMLLNPNGNATPFQTDLQTNAMTAKQYQ